MNSEAKKSDANVTVSSAPCLLHESSAEYAGNCTRKELETILLELLALKQASTKAIEHWLTHIEPGQLQALLENTHRYDKQCCTRLQRGLQCIGSLTDTADSNFFADCMGTQVTRVQLQHLYMADKNVVDKISVVLPRIGHTDIFELMSSLRKGHRARIESGKTHGLKY